VGKQTITVLRRHEAAKTETCQGCGKPIMRQTRPLPDATRSDGTGGRPGT
jgi:hypothetical protein